jgi:hypothetical protein
MGLLAPELADATRDQLIAALNEDQTGATVSATMLLDALARREAAQQTATIVTLTKWIAGMTVVVAVATVINVAVYLIRG